MFIVSGGIKFWDPSWGLKYWLSWFNYCYTMKYLFAFQFWYCELCMENRWGGGRKHCFVNFLFFGSALIVRGWGVVGWGKKFCLGPAEIASFSSQDLSQSNKHDTLWHVISTEYFCLFLWAIAVLDFLLLKIYKSLGPSYV